MFDIYIFMYICMYMTSTDISADFMVIVFVEYNLSFPFNLLPNWEFQLKQN